MSLRKIVVTVAGVAAICAVAVSFWIRVPESQQHEGFLRVTFLDVGQGDAILMQTPGGNDVLIDGGSPGGNVVRELERHLPKSDRTIELVVLTHPDIDHVGGLPDVAARYRIGRVLETSVRSDSRADQAWEQEVKKQKSKVMEARAGMTMELDEVRLSVLWPQETADLETKNRNDTSVVVQVKYGTTSWLLTGDISTVVEDRLAASNTLTDIDVLKVPHHGSATSWSDAFMDAVKPEYAVIQVGKGNPYGHPNGEIVKKYEGQGVQIYRTDEGGDVEMVSDGKQLTVSP
jgi:competence protein ComEC